MARESGFMSFRGTAVGRFPGRRPGMGSRDLGAGRPDLLSLPPSGGKQPSQRPKPLFTEGSQFCKRPISDGSTECLNKLFTLLALFLIWATRSTMFYFWRK